MTYAPPKITNAHFHQKYTAPTDAVLWTCGGDLLLQRLGEEIGFA